MRSFVVLSVFAGFLAACTLELAATPAPELGDELACEPFGFSCMGSDEAESEQLALECDAIGGYCAGDDEPRPPACPAPAYRGPHCYPRP